MERIYRFEDGDGAGVYTGGFDLCEVRRKAQIAGLTSTEYLTHCPTPYCDDADEEFEEFRSRYNPLECVFGFQRRELVLQWFGARRFLELMEAEGAKLYVYEIDAAHVLFMPSQCVFNKPMAHRRERISVASLFEYEELAA